MAEGRTLRLPPSFTLGESIKTVQRQHPAYTQGSVAKKY